MDVSARTQVDACTHACTHKRRGMDRLKHAQVQADSDADALAYAQVDVREHACTRAHKCAWRG
eukprot:3401612-Alexandrium_andersonii.AAC.1